MDSLERRRSMVDFDRLVEKEIVRFSPDHNLDFTARFVLRAYELKHPAVKIHAQRVALMAAKIAKKLLRDEKAAFFAGILHDAGKVLLPYVLFDGHNIDKAEFEEVKTHARLSYEWLKPFHLFSAYCAGLHHALRAYGYGITLKEMIDDIAELDDSTYKKILDITAIVAVCDFADAATHRTTELKDKPSKQVESWQDTIYRVYTDDHLIIDHAMSVLKQQIFLPENQPG